MRDIQDKVDASGDLLSANAFNANLINELQDFVTSAGFTLDPEAGPDTDISMFRKSVAIYSTGAMYFNESGAADAYVLTRSGNIAPMPYYFDGMTVIFKPTNDNIGASTINVDSLGVKDLVASDGSALVGGEIITDLYVMARFRSSTDDFEVVNSSAPGDAATLNGLASDTAATADTIAARDSSGDITANAFESTVATGTAPLTVASTTVVSNLNADLLDGVQNSAMVHLAGTETITGQKTIRLASAVGGVTPATSADDLIIEQSSGGGGFTIKTSDTANCNIFFSDATDNDVGYIQYQHLTNNMRLAVDGASHYLDILSSGSVQFDGNDILTSADIVEGTFTPVIEGQTTAGTGTYSVQIGRYQKIGNWVRFSLTVVWSAHTGTGNTLVAGLPYTPNGSGSSPAAVIASDFTFTAQLTALVQNAEANIKLYDISSGATFAGVAIDTSGRLNLSGSYLIA